MSFSAGDFLVFQVESGFGLLRVLDIATINGVEKIWHISAYNELFLEIEFAELAIDNGLTINIPHVAMTNRAFESTQVSRIATKTLKPIELAAYNEWQSNPAAEVIDRSIRLILGLR